MFTTSDDIVLENRMHKQGRRQKSFHEDEILFKRFGEYYFKNEALY